MLYNKINIHSELSIILRSITKMITNEILKNIKHVHFIGIGGSGMYPLVQIFHSKGYFITGSDNNETETLEAVRKLGIGVFLGQRAENIKGADLIIYTAAIMADNPELIAAKASGAICCERAEILGLVTRHHHPQQQGTLRCRHSWKDHHIFHAHTDICSGGY